MTEEYFNSLLNKSPTRLESLDLFLLLDNENDQYLKHTEIEIIWPIIQELKPEDQGDVTSKQALIDKLEATGKFQLDARAFNEFVDDCKFNVVKVRD